MTLKRRNVGKTAGQEGVKLTKDKGERLTFEIL
jgi:hypothetical protein